MKGEAKIMVLYDYDNVQRNLQNDLKDYLRYGEIVCDKEVGNIRITIVKYKSRYFVSEEAYYVITRRNGDIVKVEVLD